MRAGNSITEAGRDRLRFGSSNCLVFWAGITAVAMGILLQLPMYYDARMNHYRLAGMAIPPIMYIGMALLVVGTVVAAWALYPLRVPGSGRASNIQVNALDATSLNVSHVMLLIVLTAAVTIDVIKPATLAFVAPGAAAEYGLKGPLNPHAHGLPIALYPLSGIVGMVSGALLWGWLSDRIGRRAAILIACVIFVSSSTCGTMPAYSLNLVCCLIMGLGAGGLLPIAFTLISETIPARQRGWVMILVGGGGAGVGYIVTSWLASTIGAPDRFGWRMLWLVGLPMGLVLVILNRWIPESPRFLIEQGRDDEARAIMARYGATVTERPDDDESVAAPRSRYGEVFSGAFLGLGLSILLFGLSIGLAQYGFQQWIPSNLQKLGLSSVSASATLRDAALLGLPLSVPVAYFYGFWSSKKTIAILAVGNVCAMTAFIVGGNRLAHNHLLLQVLLILPTWSIGILASIIAAYAVEIYPTSIRSHGSGMSAGATKFGGLLIVGLAAAAVAAPSIRLTAIVSAIPMTVAVAGIVLLGPETRRRALEQIKLKSSLVRADAIGSIWPRG